MATVFFLQWWIKAISKTCLFISLMNVYLLNSFLTVKKILLENLINE